jgi:diaminopimelate epimerase
MKLKFTKMHGAGNDFVVIDAINQQIDFTPAQWQALADRRFGVGADQMLVVEKSSVPGCDFRYRIFNNDGGEVEQCGNGSRAFVKFVVEKGLTTARKITVETLGGIISPRLEDDGSVTVDMGAPVLDPAQVPFDAEGLQGQPEGRETLWPLVLELGGEREAVQVSVVSMGNPHAVQVVADVDTAPVELMGPLIEHHPRFPKRVHAAGRPPACEAARVRTRGGRDAGLRDRRLRGGGGGDPARLARFAGACGCSRRAAVHCLGGRGAAGVFDGAGGDRV